MPSPLCHALLRNLDLFKPLSEAQLESALRGAQPGGIGHRMGRLDNLDAGAGRTVAVARDHQARQGTVPMGFDRLGRRLTRWQTAR